jgi:oligopeptide transport system ATP-binding protein
VPESPEALLEARNLRKHFPVRTGLFSRRGSSVKAVDGVSFFIRKGETLGLVGESGCGKTTVGRAVLRLIEPDSGEVRFDGEDLLALGAEELRRRRREMQLVFQDPYGSLNPRMRVRTIVGEPFAIHRTLFGSEREARVEELLKRVGLDSSAMSRFPHEFSGGQRQRIGIARALALNPKLIVADEPVSALDVSIQAQITELLQDLQKQFNLAYLFISHSIPVVEQLSSRVGVMYLGKLVEVGTAEQICLEPRHPYTQALIAAVPVPDPGAKRERLLIKGDVPSPLNPPPGCHFHTRCPIAEERCRVEQPGLRTLIDGREAACHLAT